MGERGVPLEEGGTITKDIEGLKADQNVKFPQSAADIALLAVYLHNRKSSRNVPMKLITKM